MSFTDPSSVSHKMTHVNADNPWPGILSYVERDKDFFYGRNAETLELFRLVNRTQLTVLYGLSGLGKSSLLQAGLFPLVRKHNMLPVYIQLDFSDGHPDFTTQVKTAIIVQAAESKIEAPVASEGETLWEYLHRKDSDFWSDRNSLVQPLLVFDQFEEIFTLGKNAPDFQNFIEQLEDLIEGRAPIALKKHLDENPKHATEFIFKRNHYKVLLSLREDFLPELEELRVRIPAIAYNRMRLQQMNGSAALQVVTQANHLVEPSVAEQIVRFVAAAKQQNEITLDSLQVEPALLSIVCHELNHKRQQNQEPFITGDLLEGNQQEILRRFYERSINDLTPEVRAFIEDKLLTVSGYRDSIALENSLNTPGLTRRDLDQLMNRRLIRIEERSGRQRVELTHDLLTGVISSSRNKRHLQEASQRKEKESVIKLQQEKLVERAKHARRYLWLSGALTILFLLALYLFYDAGSQKKEAEAQREIAERERLKAVETSQLAKKAEADAQTQRQIAEQERSAAKQALERIAESVRLRQAVLSRNSAVLNAAFAKANIETTLAFKASAKEYPYKSVGGLPTFRFEIFPDPTSGTLKGVALITYIMDHPDFLNPLITTGPDTKFTGVYDGVGCLMNVIAVIEYSDVDKPLAVKRFNMCEKLVRVK